MEPAVTFEGEQKGKKNPAISALLSLVPGLGQVYNGEGLRGAGFLLGVTGCLVLFLLAMFGTFGRFLGEYFSLFLLAALGVWAGSAADAYMRAGRMNAGELPAGDAHVIHGVLFIAGAAVIAVALFFLFGFLLLLAGISYFESQSAMHADRHLNITVTAERTGTQILLVNRGGEPSGLTFYGIRLNGKYLNESLNATPDSSVIINGTPGPDRVVVRGCWIWGACQTFLDTVV